MEGISGYSQLYTERTMVGVVDESARTRPYRGMLFYGGAKILYDDFSRKSDALAAGLMALGVRQGEHVALLLPNSPQLMLGLHAIWKAGAIVLPLDITCREEELQQAVNGVFASGIVVASCYYDMVKRIQPRTGLRFVITTKCDEFLPLPGKILPWYDGKVKNGHKLNLAQGDLWLKQLLGAYKYSAKPLIDIKSSYPAVTFFSVGGIYSTGYIRATHRDLINIALQMRAWLGQLLDEWEDRFLLTAPLSGPFGFLNAMGTALVSHSSCIFVFNTGDFNEAIKNIRKYRIAVVMDDTEFMRGIMYHPLVRSGRVRLDSIKAGISSSAGLTADEHNYFAGISSGYMLECYAVT